MLLSFLSTSARSCWNAVFYIASLCYKFDLHYSRIAFSLHSRFLSCLNYHTVFISYVYKLSFFPCLRHIVVTDLTETWSLILVHLTLPD